MRRAENSERTPGWLASRLAAALICAVAAALTLLVWSSILLLFASEARSLAGVRLIVAVVYSETGLAIIGAAALAGACIGGDRMAEFFSVLWGTHPVWSKVGTWLTEKIEPLNIEYHPPKWILIVVAMAAAAGIWVYLT